MQASVQAVVTRQVHTAGAAPACETDERRPERHAPKVGPRRIPQRAIELVGIAFGIAIIAAVALGYQLQNDVFWSLAAGQWMLTHHSFMGLDPFSYTESHHRWVTDEWGSEIVLAETYRVFGNAAYALYAIVLGGLCLFITAAYARALGARGGRVAAIVLVLAMGISGILAGDRGLDFSLVWLPLELLILTKARGQPALVVVPGALVHGLGQHPRLDPGRLDRARCGTGLVARPGALRDPHRGSGAIDAHGCRLRWPWWGVSWRRA